MTNRRRIATEFNFKFLTKIANVDERRNKHITNVTNVSTY